MINLELLEPKMWLDLNAKLQKKKNAVRKDLAQKGVLKNDRWNDFDKYYYFSEGQYKILFTELFSKHGLELKTDEVAYSESEGTKNMAFGRMVTLSFHLIDVDTGFFETTNVTGEAFDKSDKAGFKACTGALKYYLGTTFMVATGNDPEYGGGNRSYNNNNNNYYQNNNNRQNNNPNHNNNQNKNVMTKEQRDIVVTISEAQKQWALKHFNIDSIEKMTKNQAEVLIKAIEEKKKKAQSEPSKKGEDVKQN